MTSSQLPIVIIQHRSSTMKKILNSVSREFNADMVGYMAIALTITLVIVFFNHLPS